MNTILDETEYIYWFAESATLQKGGLRLILLEGTNPIPKSKRKSFFSRLLSGPVMIDVIQDHVRRVIVEFDRVRFLQTFDEFYRNRDDESRDSHIILEHQDSALISWVKDYTVLFITDPEESNIRHYSVLTSDEIYHVLTDTEPRVYEESQPDGAGNVASRRA